MSTKPNASAIRAAERLERVVATSAEDLLVGTSEHIRNLKALVRTLTERYARGEDLSVLITGEYGTGKERLARYIHAAVCGEKRRPFVAVDCAGFAPQDLERELFGFGPDEPGLFERARGGTLFLEDVASVDLVTQGRLLRVLQGKMLSRLGSDDEIPLEARVIASCHRDPRRSIAEGTFREDLFDRLNAFPFSVAPLRGRPEDVMALAEYFMRAYSVALGKKFSGFSQNAARALNSYRWPGNIRELKGIIERATVLERGPVLELSHLRQEHLHAARLTQAPLAAADAEAEPADSGVVLNFPQLRTQGLSELRKQMDEKLVRQILVQSLTRERGNVSAVARSLRLDRANLLRMLKRFGIEPELFRNKEAS